MQKAAYRPYIKNTHIYTCPSATGTSQGFHLLLYTMDYLVNSEIIRYSNSTPLPP